MMEYFNISKIVDVLWLSAPVFSLSVVAMLALLVGAFSPKTNRSLVPALCLVGIFLTAVITIWVYGHIEAHTAWLFGMGQGILVFDHFTLVFTFIILAATFVSVLVSSGYVNREHLERAEYYSLMLFSASGAIMMAASDSLIVLFLGLELLSIPLYVLAGFSRAKQNSEEAALKYFLLGAFAGAFFVFGSGLVFASGGDISVYAAAQAFLPETILLEPLRTLGVAMILIALAFKVALVPFHFWAPDVYQGAPTSVTAFMAVVAKAAGFGALIRIGFAGAPGDWGALLWVLAAITMIWGNLLAISQNNIKRLLAYSSIGHAGYLFLGLLPGTRESVSALLFYLLAYAAVILGAFAVVILLSEEGDKYENLNDYRGAALRSPILGLLMSIFMFSLAGIPPFAGFFGKLYLFQAAIAQGYVGLTIIAVLTSVIAVFYYLRVTVVMWMEAPADSEKARVQSEFSVPPFYKTVLGGLAAFVVMLGIFSSPVIRITHNGASAVVQKSSAVMNNIYGKDVSVPPVNHKEAVGKRQNGGL